MHALLCCHTNNKKKSVYLLTATISFGEFLLRKVFVKLSCHWSRGSIAQWHLWQKWWQMPVRDMALERLFDLVAKAQYILFSWASDNHNPDLVVIQRRTFLKCGKREREVSGKKKKNSCCHFPSTQLQWWACFIYSLITFHRIPDESASHLLAPVKQFNIGKQRSLYHCTIPTWTEEPETTLHRK